MANYKVDFSPGKGRGLFASKSLKQWSVIMTEEPYAAVFDEACFATRSLYTFKEAEGMLICSGCSLARYESKAEQKADWKAGHKNECKALQACAPEVPPKEVLLIARCLWRTAKEGDSSWARLQSLGTHQSVLSHTMNMTYYIRLAQQVREFMCSAGDLDALRDERTVAEIALKLLVNAMEFRRPFANPYGKGLYLEGALLNHSCRPNAVCSIVGKRLQLIALRDIALGEEITISYVQLNGKESKLARREMLLDRYGFDIFSREDPPSSSTKYPKMIADVDGLEVMFTFSDQAPCSLDDHDQKLVELVQDGPAG